MRSVICFLVFVCLLLFSLPESSVASGLAEKPALSDQELSRQLSFIEQRLDAGQGHAAYWQKGWVGLYSVATAAQTALWLDADESDDSINYVVGALKSAAGLADALLRPMPGWKGAEGLRGSPGETRERLARGEDLLQRTATRASEQRTWGPHLKVLGLNLVGAAAIAAFGDEGDILASTAIGVAIGEAAIWSQPVNGLADYQDYQAQFSQLNQSKLHWEIIPVPAGGMARVSYRW